MKPSRFLVASEPTVHVRRHAQQVCGSLLPRLVGCDGAHVGHWKSKILPQSSLCKIYNQEQTRLSVRCLGQYRGILEMSYLGSL